MLDSKIKKSKQVLYFIVNEHESHRLKTADQWCVDILVVPIGAEITQSVVYWVRCPGDRLVGLVVKASASKAEDPGFESRLRRDFFRGRVIPVT